MYITDSKKAEDWLSIRNKARDSRDELFWRSIFKDFFWDRIGSRYFSPIESIKNGGSYSGEGFSIVTIQCSLIEFLEATHQGISYRFVKNKADLIENEYNSSKEIFINFLSKREPFASFFDKDLASEFYSSIRCGLLHEATSKNGWVIWGASDTGNKIICSESKKIFRDDLQEALKKYIKNYGDLLVKDKGLQKAFIRKFNSLCE